MRTPPIAMVLLMKIMMLKLMKNLMANWLYGALNFSRISSYMWTLCWTFAIVSLKLGFVF